MTDKEVMQMALDALDDGCGKYTDEYRNLIEALRTALAQPEPEPVAWGILNTRPTEKQPLMMVMLDEPEPSHLVVPLYTAPPAPTKLINVNGVLEQAGYVKKKEWVGLTCGDVVDAEQKCKHTVDENGNIHFADNADFAHAIEEKLKQKNA